jgi:hypothetical protein
MYNTQVTQSLFIRTLLRRGVLDTALCDKVRQWFSPDTLVSSTKKTDRHDITEILLKVAFNTINQPLNLFLCSFIQHLYQRRVNVLRILNENS